MPEPVVSSAKLAVSFAVTGASFTAARVMLSLPVEVRIEPSTRL